MEEESEMLSHQLRAMVAQLKELKQEQESLTKQLETVIGGSESGPRGAVQSRVEEKLREISLRKYDHARLSEGWEIGSENWESGLLIDLANVHERLSTIRSKIGVAEISTDSLNQPRKTITVYLNKKNSLDCFDISGVKENDAVCEKIREKACAYWYLNPMDYLILDESGNVWESKANLFSQNAVILRKIKLETNEAEEEHPISNVVVVQNHNNKKQQQQHDEADQFNSSFAEGRDLNGLNEDDVDMEKKHFPNHNEPLLLGNRNEIDEDAPPLNPIVVVKKSPMFVFHLNRSYYQCTFFCTLVISISFLVITLYYRNVPGSYNDRLSLKQKLANPFFSTSPNVNFFGISTQQQMWNFLDQSLTSYFVKLKIPNEVLIGSKIQISKLEVTPNSFCQTSSWLLLTASNITTTNASAPGNDNNNARMCYSSFNQYTEAMVSPGTVQSNWPGLVFAIVPGAFNYYPLASFGGVVNAQPSNLSVALNLLQKSNYVINQTRAVLVSFSTFNRAANTYLVSMLLFEYLPTATSGGVLPKWNSISMQGRISDFKAFDIAIGALICLLSLTNVIVSMTVHRTKAKANLLNVMFELTLVIFAILFIVGSVQLNASLASANDVGYNSTQFPDYRVISLQYDLQGDFIGVLIVLLSFKCVMYGLEGSRTFRVFSKSFSVLFGNILGLMFVTVMFATCFSLFAGYFVFGRNFENYFFYDVSFASVWTFYNLFVRQQPNDFYWSFVIFAIVIYVLFYLILAWYFFTLVAHAYISVQDEVRKLGADVALPSTSYVSTSEINNHKSRHENDDDDDDDDNVINELERFEENAGKIKGAAAEALSNKYRGTDRTMGGD